MKKVYQIIILCGIIFFFIIICVSGYFVLFKPKAKYCYNPTTSSCSHEKTCAAGNSYGDEKACTIGRYCYNPATNTCFTGKETCAAGNLYGDEKACTTGRYCYDSATNTCSTGKETCAAGNLYDTQSDCFLFSVTGNPNITTTGDNTIITFKENGTFTPRVKMIIDLFMVGGGGAGGISFYFNGSGGGGGGGIIQKSIEVISGKDYNIKIGSGGVNTATITNDVITSNDGDTLFGDITAPGGKQAGNGANNMTPGSSGIPEQDGQGGQGGSSGSSDDPTEGVLNKISAYYGGGGGGGGASEKTIGASGNGGGGKGASMVEKKLTRTAINGTPNTGGGGGGGGGHHTFLEDKEVGNVSGDGGSGIVILTIDRKQFSKP